jgi:hypothetical protein
MTEYQSYEFVALDRPLTADEMAELRAISTRAEITPTRFWNEYHWGDLKADPADLLARYFDVHCTSPTGAPGDCCCGCPAPPSTRPRCAPTCPVGRRG